jgi:hypothetical protein
MVAALAPFARLGDGFLPGDDNEVIETVRLPNKVGNYRLAHAVLTRIEANLNEK